MARSIALEPGTGTIQSPTSLNVEFERPPCLKAYVGAFKAELSLDGALLLSAQV